MGSKCLALRQTSFMGDGRSRRVRAEGLSLKRRWGPQASSIPLALAPALALALVAGCLTGSDAGRGPYAMVVENGTDARADVRVTVFASTVNLVPTQGDRVADAHLRIGAGENGTFRYDVPDDITALALQVQRYTRSVPVASIAECPRVAFRFTGGDDAEYVGCV